MSCARIPDDEQYDPVLLHTRREAVVILVAFTVCLVWSVGWCYLTGYDLEPGIPPAKVLGIPSWVFWGVLVPWLAADVFAVWFCFFCVADDPLGKSPEEKEADQAETARDAEAARDAEDPHG